MNRIHLLLALVLPLHVLAPASVFEKPADDPQPYAQKVKQALTKWQAQPELQHASFGFCMIDLATAEEVATVEKDRSLIPASVVKILTTATALRLLGDNYRYTTRLAHSGVLGADSILKGDLYILGGGDPTLGSGRIAPGKAYPALMTDWAQAIRKAGIKRIEGNIIGDPRYFEGAFPSPDWAWNDVGNYFGAAPSGLNFNENYYTLYLNAGSNVGALVSITSTSPAIEGLKFYNDLHTAASGTGDQAYIYGAPWSVERHLKGTIPLGKKNFGIKGSLPEPALTCANELRSALKKAGIAVTGNARSIRQLDKPAQPAQLKVIYTQSSPPLAEIVKAANFESLNLFAENLLYTLGKEKGRGGTQDAGLEVVHKHWQAQAAFQKGWKMTDGSGLSRTNFITSRQLALVLYEMRDNKAFRASLPKAGMEGTLDNISRNSASKGRYTAKSGTLDGIKCYAGYLTNAQGKTYAFSLMLNHFTTPSYVMLKKVEILMDELVL